MSAGKIVSAILAFWASAAAAQAAGDQSNAGADRNFKTYRPHVTAVRIDEKDAPTIDGDLSDPAWARAAIINEFYQVEPVEGAPPSQPTRAYIMYDSKALYVAIYAYDSHPELIRRSQMRRDPELDDDDAVRILLDPYGTFRDSYFFGINPNGARNDALTENAMEFRQEWDTIWRARAKVVDDGWIAEFAIPFQSISFDPSLDEWNLQIIRTIRRNHEEIRWSNIDLNRNRIDLTNPGALAGISDIKSGIGVEAQAFITGAGDYDWETGDTDFQFDPSTNIFYKISPSLTGSLTFNTDFSDTPLDARQVNTGRFSLFFPETRHFFLQDAAVFEFGGRVFSNLRNGLPFFSRNIGIVNGQPVDIVGGAKISGKAGPASVGLISARTGSADALGVDGQFLSAARVSVPVLSESKAGIIFTHGDPTGATDNSVAGADFQYKRSNVFGAGTLFADIAYIRSFSDGPDDGMAAAEFGYRSQKWNGVATVRDIGENYTPKLGFVNRKGIRRYNLKSWRSFRPADSFIRYAEIGGWANIVTNLDNMRVDHLYGAWTGGSDNAGDELWLNYEHGFVDILKPFSVAGVVPVSPGEYRWNQYEFFAASTNSRPLGVNLRVRWGGIYGGDMALIESGLSFRPSKHFELTASHEFQKFDLPSGRVDIQIASLNTTIAFTPDMTIQTEVQYDNISEIFTFFSRFNWEPVPENQFFVSFGHTALIDASAFPRDFHSLGSNLALRLGHTFRF